MNKKIREEVSLEGRDSLKSELKLLKSKNQAPEWMTYMGLQTLKQGYLLERDDKFNPLETPSEMYARIAEELSSMLPSDQDEWASKFYDLMWKGWLSPSSPVASNAGTIKGMPVSCSGKRMSHKTRLRMASS